MRTYEATAKSASEHASNWSGWGMKFESKSLRDEVASLLKKKGIQTKKSSSFDTIHPQYVTDYVGYVETGFGNSQYQMSFKLYNLNPVK